MRVTDGQTDEQTDGQTNGQNWDFQYRANIAASRGKMQMICSNIAVSDIRLMVFFNSLQSANAAAYYSSVDCGYKAYFPTAVLPEDAQLFLTHFKQWLHRRQNNCSPNCW